MRNYLLITLVFALSFISEVAYAQPTICLGEDITLCVGSPLIIENCSGSTAGSNVILLDNINEVSLSDDEWSNTVNIGFSFDYYGTTYNQCVIGSNGLISFDLANSGGYCSWDLSSAGTLPNPGFDAAKNTIMLAYQDINPSTFTSPNGQIGYQTLGTAPNREFIVFYKDINFFSCETVCNYMSIILFEGSNNIEMHIGDKPLCADWNDGLAIQGTQNTAGNIAHITPGRNNTQWNANQECKRWTPVTPANTNDYVITDEVYKLITSASTSFQWESSLGETFPYNGGILNIPSVQAGDVGYFISGSACGASLGSVSETSVVTGISSSVNASAIDDICSISIGEVTATPTSGDAPYTFTWTPSGPATQTWSNVPAGNYTVQMSDANGCLSTASVVVNDNPATFSGASTIVSCPGGSDGTAFAEMIPELGNITYLWDDINAQTTQTATGLAAGTYNCTVTSDVGCTEIVTVTITEIPGMIGSISNQSDVTCNSLNDGMIEVSVTEGTPPYMFSWNHSTTASNMADDLYVGAHTITITDDLGCVITVDGLLNQPPALSITSISPDIQVCSENDTVLSVSGTGGSSDYTFTWFENGIEIGTGEEIIVDPENTNTNYCVEFTEECGSPSTQECLLVYFPTPIEPLAIVDLDKKCVPDTFYFENKSVNAAEIATTFWEFGDNISHTALVSGANPTSHYYYVPGVYDVIMTTTSIYGCVYTDTMKSILEAVPSPTASWNFSSNPSTIFETVVQMFDKSSSDVISWEWSSPGSNPTVSFLENPTFEFPEDIVADYPVTLIVRNERGCVDTTTMFVNIVEDILFFAPTAFTPDGNELNNLWKPVITGIDIYDYNLFIYNRWGEVVWESHDPSQGWDGTFNGRYVANDTYIWTATIKNPYADDRIELNGHLSVLKRNSSFIGD